MDRFHHGPPEDTHGSGGERLGGKLITDARLGDDMLGRSGVGLQLAAELADKNMQILDYPER
jgi:hypothetical protein